MNIKDNIIKIETEGEKLVVRNKEEKLKFEYIKSKEDSKKSIEDIMSGMGLEEYTEVAMDFEKQCESIGLNQTFVKIIPKASISEDKIKVCILLWNGKLESERAFVVPFRIICDGEEKDKIFINEKPMVKPNEILVFEHTISNTYGITSENEVEIIV